MRVHSWNDEPPRVVGRSSPASVCGTVNPGCTSNTKGGVREAVVLEHVAVAEGVEEEEAEEEEG